MNIKEDKIVMMKFGSILYGLNTSNSDTDYKGIFIPTYKNVLLNNIPKAYSFKTKTNNESKNNFNDIDTEIYSLHYFIKLAHEGQTVAIDMLHANNDVLIQTTEIWQNLVYNKRRFYTKNLKAFVGYARTQAAKYGIKGSRLNTIEKILDILKVYNGEDKLKAIWDILLQDEHARFIEPTPNGIKQYQVCGKIIQETATVGYFKNILEKYYQSYGERAQLAKDNKNIDWKAVSHAIRAAYQLKSIYLNGTIIFPLPERSILLSIKNGERDYITEVSPLLEDLMIEVEELALKSSYPEKVDKKFWDEWLFHTLNKYYRK